ncbi:rhomboid-like protein [Dactylosporangium sp. NPDC048998]|uniref:rhomboid-like protein n=1 Tax=Dactylosporangium sp. NPDC048998 TaxID=3363976 RepID=UPI0037108010
MKRLYEDPPGLVPVAYLPVGDLAEALRDAGGWRARAIVCLSFLARVRLAPLYVLAVVVIGLVLDHAVSPQTELQVVLANSSNVANLRQHRIWTLFTSAFLLDGEVRPFVMVQLLLLLSVAEVLWGWRRLLEVFFLSNAVASCLVYGLLLAGVRANRIEDAITVASDVGTSYGTHAVAGALAFTLPVRARRFLVPLALGVALVPLLSDATFTDVGHLLATLLGFLAGWQMRRRPLAGRLRRPAPLRAGRTAAYSFADVAQARAALTTVLRLQERLRLRLDDAVVAWSDGARRTHLRETREMSAIDGACAGACWGVVLGTFAGLPLIGLVVGAAGAAAVAHWHDAGLRDSTVDATVRALPAGRGVLLLLGDLGDLGDPAGQPALAGALTEIGGTPVPGVVEGAGVPDSR